MLRFSINIIIVSVLITLFSCGAPETGHEQQLVSTVADSSKTQAPVPPSGITETIPLGDLDGDKVIDTVVVTMPVINEEEMSCADSTCTTYFKFPRNRFPEFSQDQALGGVIGNAGDLDNDGISELYFVADWFTSSWAGLNIYSLKNRSWKKIAAASVRRQDMGEDPALYLPYEQRIKKQNGYFEILENVMDEDGNESLKAKKFEVLK